MATGFGPLASNLDLLELQLHVCLNCAFEVMFGFEPEGRFGKGWS